MKKILLLISFICTAQVFATEDQIKFKDQQQEQLYLELIKELRCPKCQNQNIADSNAVVAKDMRVKTKELIEAGNNKDQVVNYMVDRYGQFAHYQPPVNWATSLLWLLPLSFLAIGVLVVIKRSSNNVVAVKESKPEKQRSESLDEELAGLLEKAQKPENEKDKVINND